MMNILPTAEPFFFPGGETGCLLIHGFTGTPKEMRWLGEHLAAQGHSVLGVRLAAHATRPEDMLRARWQDWLASVEDGWHLLSGCTRRIFLAGLSMGGVLALLFAARQETAGVIVMATPHHLPDDPRLRILRPLSLFWRFRPKGPPEWHDMEAYQQHASYPVDPVKAYGELNALLGEMRSALPAVTAPALLIYSRDDPTVRLADSHADQIFAALGGEDKRLVWLEGCGHVITEDAQRGFVFQTAAEFIALHT